MSSNEIAGTLNAPLEYNITSTIEFFYTYFEFHPGRPYTMMPIILKAVVMQLEV